MDLLEVYRRSHDFYLVQAELRPLNFDVTVETDESTAVLYVISQSAVAPWRHRAVKRVTIAIFPKHRQERRDSRSETPK